MLIPMVDIPTSERCEILIAYEKYTDAFKLRLVKHPSVKFFYERFPKWHGIDIEKDINGQKINGGLNIKYSVDANNPVWSPIDIEAYKQVSSFSG